MLTLSLGIMENCQTWRLNFSVGVMAGKTGECKCTTQPHLTPDRVLNAETNEKPFLDCIFDSNNLSAHIIMLTSHSNVSSQGKAGSPHSIVLFVWGKGREEDGSVSMNDRLAGRWKGH